MLEISELKLLPDHGDAELESAVRAVLGLTGEGSCVVRIARRAIDARHGRVFLNYTLEVEVADEEMALARKPEGGVRIRRAEEKVYKEADISRGNRSVGERPVIVGTGPCGLFCGLLLARAGMRPILLERGKPAGPRARDVTGFWRRGLPFDPNSNVQFGEGGAGTFSDGKLYTQIKDRENRIPFILREMEAAGAPEDILIKARPHIGTDRLIKVVRHIREEIESLGGTVRFETKMERLLLGDDGRVRGVVLHGGEEVGTDRVILAAGHSARESFEMLHELHVSMEPKPISIGVRIEHAQSLIDKVQYGRYAGNARLGAAPYKFVHHAKTGRSAYSFCMCPGGLVVAASSEAGGVVTNGMSSYARAEANANAGFMVDVSPTDYGAAANPLAGIAFQREWERRAFVEGGGNYFAPAQLLGDFLVDRPSRELGGVKPSYEPGVVLGDLRECLPDYVRETIKAAIPAIDQQLRGFAGADAVLTGVETRSSSPLRITRNEGTLQSISHPGLYPAGEGAGYAGGIVSAAVDGMRVAEAILRE